MKHLLLLLCLLPALASAQLTLEITFTGIQAAGGELRILLFNGNDGFPDNPDKAIRRKIIFHSAEKTATCRFDGLEPGAYAVSVFQDLNRNCKCDRNWYGNPVEPYGFSNGDGGRFAHPSFKRARFLLEAPGASITVPLSQ